MGAIEKLSLLQTLDIVSIRRNFTSQGLRGSRGSQFERIPHQYSGSRKLQHDSLHFVAGQKLIRCGPSNLGFRGLAAGSERSLFADLIPGSHKSPGPGLRTSPSDLIAPSSRCKMSKPACNTSSRCAMPYRDTAAREGIPGLAFAHCRSIAGFVKSGDSRAKGS